MKATIQVENLKCGGCVSSIKNGLHTIKKISAVKVNLPKDTVEVEYDGEKTLAGH